MNYALIFAGGTGIRMQTQNTPKQFLEVHGKPIIIYTLEHFHNHPEIDKILVVCIESHINYLEKLLKRYEIDKVFKIIPGGDTGFQSIYNGLKALQDVALDEDIILIHDGVRPNISESLISQNIYVAQKYGTAISSAPVTESMVELNGDMTINNYTNRKKTYATKAPQSYKYNLILNAYKNGEEQKLEPYDSGHLCSMLGIPLQIVECSKTNLKITTSEDYHVFKALYEVNEMKQIVGL